MSAGTPFSVRARDIHTRGREALAPLPTVEQLTGLAKEDRHEVLEGLRPELYAVASILADATVRRARRQRPSYPPYGLVRSLHSESRLMLSAPDPVERGAVDGFTALGKAYVDTMTFHLDRELAQRRESDGAWLVAFLEQLLALYRVDAGPISRSRMRDGYSFVYGGLHFGVGVCVQVAEVMTRLLGAVPALSPTDRAEVLARSIRPVYRVTALNIDHVLGAYHNLQSPAGSPHAGWMDAEKFVVRAQGGRPWKIDLRDEETVGGQPHRITALYATHGCPARVSPTGGPGPIATLWGWCVDLAVETGLLAPGPPT
jgi:hypothetical protein